MAKCRGMSFAQFNRMWGKNIVAKIVRRYVKGKDIYTIAKELQVTVGAVYYILTRKGV
jgi:hypothetical protein